jgi:flagellar motor switch protein FliM
MLHPYPYHQLEKLTREDVRVVEGLTRNSGLWRRAAEILGRSCGELEATLVSVGVVSREQAVADIGAGWFSGLADDSGALAGYLHIDLPLAQVMAGAVLRAESTTDIGVRQLLDVEDECLTALLSGVLAQVPLALRARAATAQALTSLPGDRVGRIAVRLATGSLSGLVTFWLTPLGWEAIDGSKRTSPEDLRERLLSRPELASLSRPIRARIARFRTRPTAISKLKAGDVLLPGEWAKLVKPVRGTLIFGSDSIAEVALDWASSFRVTLSGPAPEGGNGMKEDDTIDIGPGEDQTLQAVAGLLQRRPVTIDIVVGDLTLTMKELIELTPGRVLTLADDVTRPVDLVIEGRTVGRGELVEVEGRLGVRILQIAT